MRLATPAIRQVQVDQIQMLLGGAVTIWMSSSRVSAASQPGGMGYSATMFMRLIAFVVFVVLQFAFLPLLVLGTLMVTYRQMVVSRRLGTSQTAIEVINGRWTMDWFGIRPDPASAQLAGYCPIPRSWGCGCACSRCGSSTS